MIDDIIQGGAVNESNNQNGTREPNRRQAQEFHSGRVERPLWIYGVRRGFTLYDRTPNGRPERGEASIV